jgi:homospermidine synthase
VKFSFGAGVLVLGCGAVSQCLLPLLWRHMDMDFTRLVVMDFEDKRASISDMLAAGARYVQERIRPDNLAALLEAYLSPGDLLIDLAWNVESIEMIQWCHDHNVLYINTSVELWNPFESTVPTEQTLYKRHMALRKRVKSWSEVGATAVVEHGANPGLVSHWAKIGLRDIATAMLHGNSGSDISAERQTALEHALSDQDYARLAMQTGAKVIHISERDTQISCKPKRVNEFVNTWSVAGFYEEGIAPAEMGWGTHERRLPSGAQQHLYGPGNQICLSQTGMNTFVRSWVPSGEIIGMAIRHGEAFTLSDYLTVSEDEIPIYRPTVHYAYLPCDSALASVHELKMRSYEMQTNQRIMNDEIIDGKDELGVLLMGHQLTSWWVGSQLDICEARRLVPHQNATTLQVAAAILGALFWMIRNPRRGLCIPEDLPHEEILAVANPYLGPCLSIQTDWTPLQNRFEPFSSYRYPRLCEDNVWQFESFLV